MNRSMVIGILIGAGVAATGAAVAGLGLVKRAPAYADVIDVKPVHRTVRTPRQECNDVAVEKQKPVKDEHRLAGTAIGAVIGGVLGHQVGGGTGKDIATVAGAAAGGYAGNRVQKNLQEKDTYQTTEQRCQTVEDARQETVGYDVRYKIGDTVGTVRMKDKPGERLAVKDGKVVTDAAAPAG
ncbi:MAG: glycine zipper 2TM domain-containing protein [Proteobacteria bacterium]|nr:glycine zipper 2TM domain-containing protein [Pseudomonadota bacterium]